MALIKCVECSKEISDKAPMCPHCGCPSSYQNKHTDNTLNHNNSQNSIEINGICYDLTKVIENINNKQLIKAIKEVEIITKLGLADAKKIVDYIAENNAIPVDTPLNTNPHLPKEEQKIVGDIISCPACNNQVSNQASSCPHCGQPINTKPKCPMCNSYDIKQVTGMERAMSVGFWGFASKKINKSFECKKCGHTW